MKKSSEKIDSFDGLATLIVGEIQDLRAEMNDRFERVDEKLENADQRFGEIERELKNIKHELVNTHVEMHSGFDETKKIIERHDTRISALEYKAFGISDTQKIINNK